MNAVKIFKALSDETRLRAMTLLLEGEICVCHIMEVLSLPQSTVSRHLAYLKNSGLVNDTRKGVWNYYSINEDDSKFIKTILKSIQICIQENDKYQDDLTKLRKLRKEKKYKCGDGNC